MDGITLGYYCLNFSLTLIIFLVGSCYLRRRDRKDHQRREWRDFADKIYSDYSKLKSDNIPQKISKVKNIFERTLIHSEVTGLDVLRFMLAENNYRKFSSQSPQLWALREDLNLIFLPLNTCNSLLLLPGEVPVNIKKEFRFVVELLGNVAKPFFEGEQRKVVLRCLEYFNGDVPVEEIEKRVKERMHLDGKVPYVNSLNLLAPNPMTHPSSYVDITSMSTFLDDYSTCQKFSFNLEGSGKIAEEEQYNFEFLKELHGILENPKGMLASVRKFKEPPLNLLDSINSVDSDEVVFRKVLHEVRFYIHYLQNNRSLTEIASVDAKVNLNKLRQDHQEMLQTPLLKKTIKAMLREHASTLNFYADDLPERLCNINFSKTFSYFWVHEVAPKFKNNRSRQTDV